MPGMGLSKCAADLMIEEVQTVDENENVFDVVKRMAARNIGAVVVCNPIKDPVGIFTERDLLKRVIAEGLDPKKTRMKEVMTPKFVCVQSDDIIDDLPEIMIQGNFRHLPVADGSKIVGILSIRDIAKYLAGM